MLRFGQKKSMLRYEEDATFYKEKTNEKEELG
jgi:hypothetical protein